MEGLAPSRPPTVHAEMQFPPRQEVTMTALRLVTVLGTLALSAAAPGFPIFNPAQFVWKPKDALPPGAHGAVVRGDPQEGPYAFFGPFPPSLVVPLPSHTHTPP